MCKSREWLVDNAKTFWVRDNVRLHSLGELAAAVAFMSPETYALYVSDDKNDFADWVDYSFEEPELAMAMRADPSQEAVCLLLCNSLEG